MIFLPNVKDEPRRELARRVQQYDSLSEVSIRRSFGRTRRDRSRRWLRRLVGLYGWDWISAFLRRTKFRVSEPRPQS